jgi:hypothetical protein
MSEKDLPDDKDEGRRIKKAGGYVVEGWINGNLNISRALGNLNYKDNKALTFN